MEKTKSTLNNKVLLLRLLDYKTGIYEDHLFLFQEKPISEYLGLAMKPDL